MKRMKKKKRKKKKKKKKKKNKKEFQRLNLRHHANCVNGAIFKQMSLFDWE